MYIHVVFDIQDVMPNIHIQISTQYIVKLVTYFNSFDDIILLLIEHEFGAKKKKDLFLFLAINHELRILSENRNNFFE